jgi:type I restriction enzyme S subunit
MSAMRLKFVFEPTIGGVWGDEPKGDTNDMICVRVADFNDVISRVSTAKLTTRNILPSEQRGRVLQQGDLLLEKSGGGEQTAVGRTVLFDHEFQSVCSNFITLLRPQKTHDPIFLAYLSRALYLAGGSIPHIKQTTGIQNLDCSSYLNQTVEIPPIQKQRSIAAYLDEQTGKIDRLIELRRRQMTLLKEQRTALIQEAVTRGLNPNTPMKDSGLPWLGEIPAHWKTVPLGYLAILLQTGPFGSQLHAHEYIDGGIPVINPSHMADGLIQPDLKCTVDEATAKRLSRHFLQFGDVVFARRGELGRCALVRDEEVGWICGTGSLLMRPEIRTIEPQFLVTLFKLKRLKESLILQSVGSTMDNLNTGILSRTGLPLPPLCEQNEILIFIDEQRAKFDTLHDSYTRQLSLLTEYRTALIHECVTGQRSVPETVTT